MPPPSVPHAEKFGYIDASGKLLISARFDFAECSHEGLALVQLGSKYGFIDKTGNLAIPASFDQASSFSEGLAAVSVGTKWGFIDSSGRMVIPPRFDDLGFPPGAKPFSEGLAAVTIDGTTGYIDKTGKIMITPQFDLFTEFSEGLAAVRPRASIPVNTWLALAQSPAMTLATSIEVNTALG